MASMHRADARRGARADRRHDLQAPYGPKPTQKKSQKSSRGGLWNFIKSWSFFTPDEDVDMTSDADSDDGPPAPGAWSAYPTHYNTSSSSENSTSGNEEGSATSVPSNHSSPITTSSRTLQLQKPSEDLTDKSVVAINTTDRLQELSSNVVGNESSDPIKKAPKNDYETTQQQVARFLLSKKGAFLTPQEFELTMSKLRSAVVENATPGDVSILTAGPPNGESAGQPTTTGPEKSGESSQLTQPGAESSQQKREPDSDNQSNSSATLNNLPPFRSTDTGTPPPESSESPSADTSHLISDEEREEAEYRARLEQRSNELRQLLNIDYTELYEPGAWEELVRYKGVKYPSLTTPEQEEVVPGKDEAMDTAEAAENGKEAEEMKKVAKDPNEGYTPEELMINPYERISAFKGRKRKPMSHYLRTGRQTSTSHQGQPSNSTVPADKHQDTQKGAATESPMVCAPSLHPVSLLIYPIDSTNNWWTSCPLRFGCLT
ncbi:hypothetical protein CPB86DRAFT_779659 [Serendipita vermifera]|nr:hypothetical protein CPB86DRAFT_779659 [Serendipita vermifera]